MRTLYVEIGDAPLLPGLAFIDDAEIYLSDEDAHDLNELASITTLTTSGEEVAIYPDYAFDNETEWLLP